MGNVGGGKNNDDLIDMLRFSGYIETKTIERVFRAVDRGDYVLAAYREDAYKDLSWKIGNIHLSAPCIYGKVMEGLSLKPGLSFLNLGSGTGYLSTMAGLILSHYGTNHGIELNKDCLEYAYEKLDEFKQKSLALNEFDFCEPVFMHGNCLKLTPNRQYDRVYCGAACPESHEAFIKRFVKIGGILVMPYKEHLLRIERIGEDTWRHKAMLPVSFAPLIIPKDDDERLLQLPYSEPLSLQELSRCIIRSELRKLLWETHPGLQSRHFITTGVNETTENQTSTSRQILPENNAPETFSSSNDDDDSSSYAQLFFHVDTNLKAEESVPTTRIVRSIMLSRTNECSIDIFNNKTSDNDGESLNAKYSGAVDASQSMTIANSPSTSYQNNIVINTLCENDNKSPNTDRIVNIEVTNDQSSTVSSAEKINEFFQCYSDDDAMDLDIPTKQLEPNPNFIFKNEINSTCLNDDKVYESKQKQNHCEMIDDHIEKPSKNPLERITLMNDSSGASNDSGNSICRRSCSNNSSSSSRSISSSSSNSSNSNKSGSSSSSCSSGSSSNKNSSSSEDDDEKDTNTSKDCFRAFERRRNKWGLSAYRCRSGAKIKKYLDRPTMKKTDDQESTHSLRSRQIFAHNVNINVFSAHMKDRISKLPLPTILLTYMNYNRTL